MKWTRGRWLSGLPGGPTDLMSVMQTAQPSSACPAQCRLPLKPSWIPFLLPKVPSTLVLWHVLQPTLCRNVHLCASHLLDLRITGHRSLIGFITPSSLPRPGVVQGQKGEALTPHFTNKETETGRAVPCPRPHEYNQGSL